MIDDGRDVFSGFLFISAHISFDLLSLGSAEAYIGWGGKLNGHLMASCVRNFRTRSYQNLMIVFQVTVKNVRDVFLRHSIVVQCLDYLSFCCVIVGIYWHTYGASPLQSAASQWCAHDSGLAGGRPMHSEHRWQLYHAGSLRWWSSLISSAWEHT